MKHPIALFLVIVLIRVLKGPSSSILNFRLQKLILKSDTQSTASEAFKCVEVH